MRARAADLSDRELREVLELVADGETDVTALVQEWFNRFGTFDGFPSGKFTLSETIETRPLRSRISVGGDASGHSWISARDVLKTVWVDSDEKKT